MINLDINIGTFVIQLIATAVLFVVVANFFAKPMKTFLAKREAFVQASFNKAEEALAQASATKQELDEELAKFKADSHKRLEDETLKAQEKAKQVVDEARKQVTIEMDKAEVEISQKRNAMLKETQAEIATITTKATEELIKKEIDEKAHSDLFDEFVRLVGGANE